MGDLTKNFSYSEIKPSEAPSTWKPETRYQDLLIKQLFINVQAVRDIVAAPMKCTSGVRDPDVDFDKLKSEGYNPSITSDHYCGHPVKIPEESPKRPIYGEYYIFPVGAVDIVPKVPSVWEFYRSVVELVKSGKVRFGQVIYETYKKVDGTKVEWIHFGGNPEDFFSNSVAFLIKRQKFLMSIDGGKSYQVYTV